jgi:hypothetical protein
MTQYDEERLGTLLGVLRPAPAAWVEAAQVLPGALRALDGLIARPEADIAFRQELIAGLEAALEREGVEPSPRVVEELRKRLAKS